MNTGPGSFGRPNILFIAVDDMNDWIGVLGGSPIAYTPNLDRLASQSLVFTNAHCASPACSPSRLSIMSGIEPSKTGKIKNEWYDGPQWRKVPAYTSIETLEQFFRNRGYETLGGGKIYHALSPPWTTISHADPEGWDYYFPSVQLPVPFQIRAEDTLINPERILGERHGWFTWGPLDVPDQKMSDYQVVNWASRELATAHAKPFFLACGIFRPHMPWEVPRGYFEMYPIDGIPDLPVLEDDLRDAYEHPRRLWHRFVVENNQWKHVIQAYLASISFADAQIGHLLEALEGSEYRDNTIIVLWADHGMHLGEKENWEKFTLWEESTRVPLFFRVPGQTKPGTKCNAPVSLLDIYPTLAELAGFDIPLHCDGISLMEHLNKPGVKSPRSAMTTYSFQNGNTGHALRSESFRYIYYTGIGLEELYDHSNDPNEFVNLAYRKEYEEVLQRFRKELVSRVGTLSLEEIAKAPEGYTIYDGNAKNNNFVKGEDLPFLRKHFPLSR